MLRGTAKGGGAITTNAMEIGVFWLLLITLIIGLVVSSVKCKNYRCLIKYGLLAGAIVGIIYSFIISLFFDALSSNCRH